MLSELVDVVEAVTNPGYRRYRKRLRQERKRRNLRLLKEWWSYSKIG